MAEWGSLFQGLSSGIDTGARISDMLARRELENKRLAHASKNDDLQRQLLQWQLTQAQRQANPAGQFDELEKLLTSKGVTQSALQEGQSFIPGINPEGQQSPPVKIDWNRPEAQMLAQAFGFKPNNNRASLGVPSGAVANQLRLQAIESAYGKDSPQAKAIRDALELEQKNKESQINYRNVLADTAPTRSMSSSGKQIKEYRDLLRNDGLSPDERDQAIGFYEKLINKGASDTDARKRARFGQVMERTIDNLDLDALVQGSGIYNRADLEKAKLKANFGGEVDPNLLNYYNALTTSSILAKQIRQFYGDSITPTAQEAISKLTNPNSLLKNPDISKSQLQQLLKILRQESSMMNDMATPFSKTKLDFNDGQFNLNSGSQEMVTIRNNKTGETKRVTKQEAENLMRGG